MPTSSYMPDVTVEIAFDSGFLTPAASRTWTDVSAYVELHEGININVGRGDERSTADANQCTLTLDNRDGRFTPGKTTGAYYPNVKLGRPIRVKATPVDGAQSTRFLGFIDEWALGWTTGTDSYAAVSVTASSRLSRLGLVAGLNDVISQAILANSPVAHYTMGEPTDSTQANDTSGTPKGPLVTVGDAALPLVFGSATGPGTDGLTAVQFGGGQFLQGSSAYLGASGSGFTLSFFALLPTTAASTGTLVAGIQDDLGGQWTISTVTGHLAFSRNGSALGRASSTTSVLTGTTMHFGFVYDGGQTLKVYVNSVLEATTTHAQNAATYNQVSTLTFGDDGTSTGSTTTGVVIAHAALFNGVLTTELATISDAGLTGYAGETTSARLARYLAMVGVEAVALSAETGQVTVQNVDTTDKQVVELMRLMETTEGGVLFDHRDGTLTFQNRGHRLNLSSSYTLDMAQQMVESDYAPKLDRSALANDVSAQDVAGKYKAHVVDATSKTDNGVATMSIETAAQDDDEPRFLASWALYKYKTPLSRVTTLSVDALAQVGKTPSCFTVMATNVSDKITVSNRPTQDSATSAAFFVEGWTETYGPESLRFTFNVSPASPDDQTLIIGDSGGRGVIGTNPVAL